MVLEKLPQILKEGKPITATHWSHQLPPPIPPTIHCHHPLLQPTMVGVLDVVSGLHQWLVVGCGGRQWGLAAVGGVGWQ